MQRGRKSCPIVGNEGPEREACLNQLQIILESAQQIPSLRLHAIIINKLTRNVKTIADFLLNTQLPPLL